MPQPPRRLDAEQLWEYAVRVLAGRACSTAEMQEKLRNRAARASDVPAVIARLKDAGYLDDARFAESFAAARLENRQFGRFRVLRDLRGRRVAATVADRAVRTAYQGADEGQLIEEYIQRRLRPDALADERGLAAAYRKLMRAGFSATSILQALKRRSQHPGLLDMFEPPQEPEHEP